MTGQPPDLLPQGLGLPQDAQVAEPPLWPQDPDSLARIMELDQRLRDPVQSKRAAEDLRKNLGALVTVLDAQWHAKQQALAQQQQQDGDLAKASERYQVEQRATDLLTEMRTSGIRSPELERTFDDQILSMQGVVSPEMSQQLRDTRQRIGDFRDLAPALKFSLGNRSYKGEKFSGEIGATDPAARGVMGLLTGGTYPMDLQSRLARDSRAAADRLESAFFDSPREFASKHLDANMLRAITLSPNSEQYAKEEQERARQELRVPLEDMRNVNAPAGYEPKTRPANLPKGMTRDMFRMATADAIVSNLSTYAGAKATTGDKLEEVGTLIGQLPIFGGVSKAGEKVAEGLKRLWKGAPKSAMRIASGGAQGFLAYEFGANVLDPSPAEMEEIRQLPEGIAAKHEAALRQRNGIATVAILPIMAAVSSPLAPAKAASRSGLLNRGAAGRVGGVLESSAEGAATGALMPAAGEMADTIARHMPNEQGQLMADMYAAKGVYGPLEDLYSAVTSGDGTKASEAARHYADELGIPVMTFGAIHALKAVGATRLLNGKDKIRLFVQMSRELKDSGLPVETQNAIADQGQKILEEVAVTKEEDKPRQAMEALSEKLGGNEQARQAVDDRHSAEDLPHHEGKTLADKAATIEEKLTEANMKPVAEDPEQQLRHESEVAALESEMLAVRARRKGDEERAQQHLARADGLRAGEIDPREDAPDTSTPESQAAAESARAMVDLKREAKGAQTAEEILQERAQTEQKTTARSWDELQRAANEISQQYGDKATPAMLAEKLGIKLPAAERLHSSIIRKTKQKTPDTVEVGPETAAAAVPAPHPKATKAERHRQLVEDARSIRQQHGDQATPQMLSKALGISEPRAKKLHAEIAPDPVREAPPAPVPQVPVLELQPGGWARTTPEHSSAAGAKDVLGRITKIDGDIVTVKPKSGKAVQLHRSDLRAIDAQSVADHATMSRRANASKAAKERQRVRTDDDVLSFIAKQGGISHEAAKQGGKQFTDERGRKAAGVRRVFTEKGMDWDRLAQNLIEAGYLDPNAEHGYGVHAAQELVARALAGEPVMSQEGYQAKYDNLKEMREWEAEVRASEVAPEPEPGSQPIAPAEVIATTPADAVQPSGVPLPTTPADVAGPRKIDLRAEHEAVKAKVKELKAAKLTTEQDADRAYVELLEVAGHPPGVDAGQRLEFEQFIRNVLHEVETRADWEALAESSVGTMLRGPEGQALQFSKEGRDLLALLKKLQRKFIDGPESGAIYFPVDELVDALMPRRERTLARIQMWADTLQHPVPLRGGLSGDLGDAFRTLHGRLGVVGTSFQELHNEMGARLKEVKAALGTLRGLFPRGGPEHRLKGLVEAVGKKAEDLRPEEILLLESASPKERGAVDAVVKLLSSFREVVANYRDGVAQMRLFHRDLEQHVERDSIRVQKAEDRVQEAEEAIGMAEPGSDEAKLAAKELRNAKSALKSAEEALVRSTNRRGALESSIRDRVAEFGRDSYFPHVSEMSRKERRELYRHVFDAPPELGSPEAAGGGYRIGAELQFATSGHSKRRTGELEEQGQLMRDDLDALYYYFADVVPKAMHNKWLMDNYDALHGKRRMLTDDELKRGRGMGIVIQRRDPYHYSEHRVRGGFWKAQTKWGSILSKSKLTPGELAKWVLKDPRVAAELRDAKAESPEALEAKIEEIRDHLEGVAKHAMTYGIVLDSPHTRDMPRDAWSGERIGWFEARHGLDHVPIHALSGTMWEREGGLRQRLLGHGTEGARQWLAVHEAQRDMMGWFAEEQGALPPAVRKLSQAAAHAITSVTIGLANVKSAINAYFGAIFGNSITMGARASLRHAPMIAKHLKVRLLQKTSFQEWVRGLKINLDDSTKPLWQNEALRAAITKALPQRTPLEKAQATAVFLWQTSPYYSATVRGRMEGGDAGLLGQAAAAMRYRMSGSDVGEGRGRAPEWIPRPVRSAGHNMRRFAKWFGETGQYLFWHGLESNMRGHVYMGTVVDALMAGKTEAQAIQLANRATVATHGGFGRMLKSPMMRNALLAPLGSVTNWMQHMAGTNVRMATGTAKRGVAVPEMGGIETGQAGGAAGKLMLANAWARQIALVQLAAALGLATKDWFGRDVTGQIGGRTRDIPLVGETLEFTVEDASSAIADSLGVTAEKFPRLHDQLAWRSTDFPIPVLPASFSGPALSLLRYGSQFIHGVLVDDERERDMAAARLQSTALGSNYRMVNRAFRSRAVPGTEDTYETVEPFTGRTLERIHGSGMSRLALDLIPGVPLEEQINYETKRRAQRRVERLRREGSNFHAKARALYNETRNVTDQQRKQGARAEFNELVRQHAKERSWTKGEFRSFMTELQTNNERDLQTGLVRQVLDMPTQESKLEMLLDLMERGQLDEKQAVYIRSRLIGKRPPSDYFREIGPELRQRYRDVWEDARETWKSR